VLFVTLQIYLLSHSLYHVDAAANAEDGRQVDM
jgi:hypothetical protein